MIDSITDVPKIMVGHAQNLKAATGCTVILCKDGAIGGVDVRGGAPGTRETDLLDPRNLVEKVHAVYLSGGSAFGLDGAAGVMQFLEERGCGFDVKVTKVPIVCGAVVFDLDIGDFSVRPNAKMGYDACLNAKSLCNKIGNVGAGTGATVGKVLGSNFSMKGGLGTASVKSGDLVVGALVVVNCFGDVVDPRTGNIIAGALNKDKTHFTDTVKTITKFRDIQESFGENTTIGVVATNAKLTKSEANKIASMAHNGYARAIRPVHTMYDGDTIFCLSVGSIKEDVTKIGVLGAKAMEKAIVRAVKGADSLYGKIAWKDMKESEAD